jgi:hypothetical protein
MGKQTWTVEDGGEKGLNKLGESGGWASGLSHKWCQGVSEASAFESQGRTTKAHL